MSVLKRGLEVKYFAKSAPKVSRTQYSELMKEFNRTGKLPPRLEIVGIAVDDSMNANKWKVPVEDLDEVAEKLKGCQVRKNHSDRVEDIIGTVTNAWREDNKVFYEAEIADEDIIKKLILGYIKYSSIQVYSDDVYCANCLGKSKNEMEAKITEIDKPCPRCGGTELVIRHPQPIEISIVSLPAYESAIVMPVGFKAGLDATLSERFKYQSSLQNTHVQYDTTISKERNGSENSLQHGSSMSFKAQDTATPSAEIKEPKPLSYEDVMKMIADSQKNIQEYFDKALKALSEEVKKLSEEVKKKKDEEEEEEEEPEEPEEEEEEEEEEEAKKKKLEAKKKLMAKLIAKRRREELKKLIEEKRKKKEEEEAKKKKIEELKKKLEEVKKKIEEAKKKKLAEASASGKGIVGEVKEETKAEGELPAWFKEIYKASKELEKRGLLG